MKFIKIDINQTGIIMNYTRKLRPPTFPKEFLLPFIILPAFILVMKLVSFSAAYMTLVPFFAIAAAINFLIFRRTKNLGFFVVTVCMLLATIMSVLVGIYGRGVFNPALVITVVLLVITFPIILYMLFTKKTKWRKREMLELAAFQVDKTHSGFTTRPFPAGTVECSQEELDAFVQFMKVNMIALPVYDYNRVNLVINSDYEFIMGLSLSYKDKTWISIDNEGQVLVHISKKDYLLYRDTYSYDKLCESLGAKMIEFLNLYLKEEEQRIIDMLNDLNLHAITEA